MLHQWFLLGRRPHSLIKSVQAGTIALGGGGVTSVTATLSQKVIPQNAILVYGGSTYTLNSNQQDIGLGRLELTDSVTVTAYRKVGNAAIITVAYQVIEFYPGVIKTAQRGTIDLNGVASANATLPIPVDPQRCFVGFLGFTVNTATSGTFDLNQVLVRLTNGTTVNASVNTLQAVEQLVGYEVIEFY